MGRAISEKEKIGIVKKAVATGCFIGYLPVAPATFSCVISILIWYVLLPYRLAYIVVTVLLILCGIWLSDDLSKQWGEDPSQIVIDEYATFLIPLYFTPLRVLPLIITFVLFRIFDILKPPPLRYLERLDGGWGIVLDDVGAAVYTTIVCVIIQSVFSI